MGSEFRVHDSTFEVEGIGMRVRASSTSHSVDFEGFVASDIRGLRN
jgi:hypothetical protein